MDGPHPETTNERTRAWRAGLIGAAVIVAAVVLVLVVRDSGDDAADTAGTTSVAAEPDRSTVSVSATATPSSSDPATTTAPGSTSVPGTTGTSTPATTPTSSTTTDAPAATTTVAAPSAVPDEVVVEQIMTDFLDATPEVISAPEPGSESIPPSDPSELAMDAMLDELEATRAEFTAMGWTQVGVPTVVSVEAEQPGDDDSPDEVTVLVCLDSSDVRILDEAGNDVRSADTPPRSLNIYILRWSGDQWLPAEHTFPEDPDC